MPSEAEFQAEVLQRLVRIEDGIEALVWRRDRRRETARLGERSPLARLSTLDVRVIRRLRGVLFQKDVAKIFGVSTSQVSAIQSRERWAHLPAEHPPLACK